jgi:antitoxin component of RelBE/YafQ-DinJ toxin-antitoxin module
MDAKVTLSFDENVIKKAKKYADQNNISLSRLVEFLLGKIIHSGYRSLEDYPIADWVSQVAEGKAIYQTSKKRSRKAAKSAYFSSKK